MNEILTTLGALPVYVLIFIAFMGYIYSQHKQLVATAVQAEAIKSALALAALGQQEANRLRDETNKQNERWLSAFGTMNERFIVAITGQTTAITHQSARLDTMDTSVASLPALTTTAQGTDEKIGLALAMLKVMGVGIQDINRAQGLLGVDIKDIAKFLDSPTAANKQKVEDIAAKTANATEKPAEPVPGSPATLEVALPVTLVAAETPA